jgi:peptide/nickel transport system substrate-binding protein
MDSQSSAESREGVDPSGSSMHRRKLLRNAGIGTAVLMGLAGCSGDSDDEGVTPINGDGKSGSNDGNEKYVDTSLDIIAKTPPQNAQFNPYSPSAKYDFRWYWAQFDQLAVHDSVDRKTKGLILKDWEYKNNGEVIWKVRDTYEWHNGKDLTAEDIAVQLKIGKLMGTVFKGYGARPAYKNVETTGKYELRFDLQPPNQNRALFEWNHMKRRAWLWSYRGNWRKYAEMYDDATTDKAISRAREKMLKDIRRPITDSSVLPGNSVWNPVKVSGPTLHFKPYENYKSPFGDHTGKDVPYFLTSTYYTNQQQRTAAMKDESLDISYAPKSKSARQAVRDVGFAPPLEIPIEEIDPESRDLSMGYIFNMQDPISGNRNVRRAIAHVIPRQPLISWHPDYKAYWIPDEHLTGLGQDTEVPFFGGSAEGWPNGTLKGFEQYAYTENDVDTKRATELLKREGFSKQGDRWHDSNGKPVTLQMYTATSSEEPIMLKGAQIMKSYLNGFGLTTELTAQKASIRSSKTLQSGNWHLMPETPGNIITQPFADYATVFFFLKDWTGKVLQERKKWGMNSTVEVPYPIGNPDGGLKKVNVYQMINSLRTNLSDQKRKKLVEEISWIYNQSLPLLPITEEGGIGGGGYWINKDRWRTYKPKNGKNPVYRYMVIEAGEYAYGQYATKFPSKWFGPQKRKQ